MNTFYQNFKPVIRIANSGGVYLPGCEIIYPKHGRFIKTLVHICLVAGSACFITAAAGEINFLVRYEKQIQGLTDYYIVLSLGTLLPSFFGVLYLQWRSRDIKRVIEIWENDFTCPPFQDLRQAEVDTTKKFMSKLVKYLVLLFILPLMLWLARPFVTRKEVIPTAFMPDQTKSPAFEIVTSLYFVCGYFIGSVCSAVISIQLLLSHTILAELNHLQMAAHKIFSIIRESKYEGKRESEMLMENQEDVSEVRRLVRAWVVHHQAVLRYGTGVSDVLGPLIIVQLSCTVVFVFTVTYVLFMANLRVDQRMDGILYLIFYYSVLYKMCSMGDDIQIKSRDLMTGMLGKEWYLYPKDVLQNILIMYNVTVNRPIRLRSFAFTDLSRKSFKEIVLKGYELVTFMGNLTSRRRIV